MKNVTITVGEIKYTNAFPFFYYVDRNKLLEKDCHFLIQTPATLNREMKAGRIQVGPISSFAYAENVDEFVLMPNLSVSANGPVGSIFLYTKRPLEELEGSRIALTTTSATSVHLLKILLKQYVEVNVTYDEMDPSFDEMMQDHDGCLLIGDEAIVTSWREEVETYRYDLGELWKEYTGTSMTFAVFAVRKDAIARQRAILEELYTAFVLSKEKNRKEQYASMIRHIQKGMGGTTAFWNHYFSNLVYDFHTQQQKGLLLFYEKAYEEGFLPKPIESIKIWGDVRTHHSSLM